MKRLIRVIRVMFAIIATFTLLFINIGPFTVNVLAWENSPNWSTPPAWNNESTWKTPPKWETPKWKTSPKWESPGWDTQPSWKTSPNWKSPGWDTQPSWKNQPNWESPGWENQPSWENQPNWESPGWETQPPWENQPNWNEPNWNQPNWENPGWNQMPGQNNDGSNVNDPTSPDGITPNTPGDPNSPIPPNDHDNNSPNEHPGNQLNPEQSKEKSKDASNENGPFFEFVNPDAKGAIKFSVKDIVGGNINLIDQYYRKGNLDLKDFEKWGKNTFTSGFKLFTKGDPTVDALYDGYDFIKKPKEIYDKYNTYKEVKRVDDLRKAGNIVDYAREFENLYQNGKSFSTGNTVVSAITMPLTIWDTVDNVKKLNNAKTAEEKSDAKWGLFENSGSIIAGAAPFVAMIPGAQPIAAGMVVVGAAIGAISLGRKLWVNRKKIVDNVVKKAKKIGNWFKSLF